jgi:hypothetical protein
MPARFKPDYVAKIKRAVRRYQKERSKLIRRGVFENVPQQVSYRDLVSKYYTKREMNKRLKEMSLFTATKATKARTIRGKATTEYEIQAFKLTLGRQRKEVEREIKLIEREGWNEARLRHDRYLADLRSRQNELSRNWRELIGTRAGRSIMNYEHNRDALYSNYIQALFQDAENLGLTQDQMNEMIAKFNTLTPRQFERMFNEDPDIGYIFNYYNSLTDKNFEIEENQAKLALQKIYRTLDSKIKYYKNI